MIREGLNAVPPCGLVEGCPVASGGVVVSLADVASFRPGPVVQVGEPDGWAVVGLPTNFVASGSVSVVSGVLLGVAAEVRFTPVGFVWSFEDGSVVRSVSGGARWAALGQEEFTVTATSHVFERRGWSVVEPAVEYVAEYRFGGGGWTPIAGVLTVPGEVMRVRVVRVETVLVADDCNTNPNGPGC